MKKIVKLIAIFILFLVFFLSVVSCGGVNPGPDHREAELVVEYNGKKVYERKPANKGDLRAATPIPKWNTKLDLKRALDSKTRPLVVIFSSEYCGACKSLERYIKNKNWRKKVLLLNVDYTWAYLLSREFKFDGIPSMVVVEKNQARGYAGLNTIISVLTTLL